MSLLLGLGKTPERQQRDAVMRNGSNFLLAQFDHAALSGDHHQRGYLLQDLLGRTFDLHGISVSGEVAQANSPAIQNSSSISNSLGDCCAPSPSAGLIGFEAQAR